MSSDSISTPPPSVSPPPDNPFYYGWRYINRHLPDGRVTVEQVPLTLEDVLHPQEDDVIPERPRHEIERGYLAAVFRTRLPGLDRGAVFSDCLVDWGVEGIGNHSPDVSVFEKVQQPPDPDQGIFHLAGSAGQCVLVIELVSVHTRTNDVDRKLEEYHHVGVPLYILVDQEREDGPRRLVAYEHQPAGYARVPLDQRNRLFLGPFGICLGLKDNWVVCYDTVSGRELGDYQQVTRDLDAAEAARQAAETQAQREAEARQAAEAARQAAEAARQAAEAARQAAEKRETEVRQMAEAQARNQAEANTRLEERLRELEAQLHKLRGQG
jgi:colicin import membrane protein